MIRAYDDVDLALEELGRRGDTSVTILFDRALIDLYRSRDRAERARLARVGDTVLAEYPAFVSHLADIREAFIETDLEAAALGLMLERAHAVATARTSNEGRPACSR